MTDHIFHSLAVGFLAGVCFASFFSINIYVTLLLALIAICIAVYFVQAKYSESAPLILFVALFFAGSAIGAARFNVSRDVSDPLRPYENTSIRFTAIVIDEPDIRVNSVLYRVHVQKVGNTTVDSIIQITGDLYPEYHYGDLLKGEGMLARPKEIVSDTDVRTFDYPAYLRKDGISFVMLRPKLNLVSSGNGNFIKTKLFAVKHFFIEKISSVIPRPQSALAGGLLLGGKQALGDKIQQQFKTAGIIHIVVLSGYNITIVAESIIRVLATVLPTTFATGVGVISILLFAVMTGAGATVIRASIMVLLVILARATKRQYNITRALWLAAVGMVAVNPYILVFDSSFQLSFMATVGVVYITPFVERYLMKFPKWSRAILAPTIATQLFVLPMLLYKTGQMSLVSLPANLLITWIIPYAMLFVFLTALASIFGPLVAIPFAAISYFLLSYILKTAAILAAVPFASVPINISLPIAISMYIMYAIIYWRISLNARRSALHAISQRL
ncbi:ComEC family competence protein [Candidatus Parcubacteria bacterium]|nr:ComEC family competence protein [Candidatus Parcubacteria bacterium]